MTLQFLDHHLGFHPTFQHSADFIPFRHDENGKFYLKIGKIGRPREYYNKVGKYCKNNQIS